MQVGDQQKIQREEKICMLLLNMHYDFSMLEIQTKLLLYLFFNSLSEFKYLSLNFIFLSIQQIMVGVFPVFATQRDDSS